MKRKQLFEFEDQAWFPHWIRECMTRYIVAVHRLLGTSKTLAKLVARAMEHSTTHRIIDLCSGSGGPMLEVADILRKHYGYPELTLTLSDLYPNQEAATKLNQDGNEHTEYLTQPVNAADLDKNLEGVRTMVCSLHHMPPEVAKGILKNAQQSQQPICIYEISDNSIPRGVRWLALPTTFIMVFFITPLIRPMTWQQLVFTYLIPILPLAIAWDGAVSNIRTYTLSDLDTLLADLQSEQYTWEKGTLEGKGGNKLYLLGLPLAKKTEANTSPENTEPTVAQD
ncbi:MAG: hypothetical protein ACFB15_10310 [Cyclobacteriaceae bacterium]